MVERFPLETSEAVGLPGPTLQDQRLCSAHHAALTAKSLILHLDFVKITKE